MSKFTDELRGLADDEYLGYASQKTLSQYLDTAALKIDRLEGLLFEAGGLLMKARQADLTKTDVHRFFEKMEQEQNR